MPRTVQKTLTFPMAGVSRRGSYREQARPYAAPWAVNVRGVGPLERRDRGGSRPGLVKVHSTDFGAKITAVLPVTGVSEAGVRTRDIIVIADGTFSYLRGTSVVAPVPSLSIGGEALTVGTDALMFTSTVAVPVGESAAHDAVERAGRLYLADTVLREYDPITGTISPVVASAGAVPAGCPLVALYRDRVFLSGADHVWYCSRQGDPTDWDFGKDMADVGRAVAGQVERSGVIGEPVKAMIPYRDSTMIISSHNSMWLLRGDPTDGSVVQISNEIGVLSPGAWAVSPDGLIAFLCHDGVYLAVGGSADAPKPWSTERVPDELRNIDPTTNIISMVWDVRGRGFHLFITPETGTGTHWWLDMANKALWPVHLQADHQPVAVSRLQGSSGLSEVVLGCKDGYLRKFSDEATTDDSTDISSHVLVGPFRLTSNDVSDAILAEIHGSMADNAGYVTWRVVMGSSAEAAVDTAVAGIAAALAGTEITGVAASGVWLDNLNRVERPRARGPWAVVWLSSKAAWAYEAVAVVINQLGRLRQ